MISLSANAPQTIASQSNPHVELAPQSTGMAARVTSSSAAVILSLVSAAIYRWNFSSGAWTYRHMWGGTTSTLRIGLCVALVAALAWLVPRRAREETYFLGLSLVLIVLPATVIISCNPRFDDHVVVTSALIAALGWMSSWVTVAATSNAAGKRLGVEVETRNALLTFLTCGGIASMWFVFGIPQRIVGLDDVYAVRLAARSTAVGIAAYLPVAAAGTVFPMAVIIGVIGNRKILAALGLIGTLWVYGSWAPKYMVYETIAILGLGTSRWLQRKRGNRRAWFLIVAAGAVFLTTSGSGLKIYERSIALPSAIDGLYAEHFSSVNKTFVRPEIAQAIGRAYSEPAAPIQIGRLFFRAETSANSNTYSEGFAAFGMVGVVLFSVGFSLSFVMMRLWTAGMSSTIRVASCAHVGLLASTSSFATFLLTSGGVVIFFFGSRPGRPSASTKIPVAVGSPTRSGANSTGPEI
jgi:hypothetical protein